MPVAVDAEQVPRLGATRARWSTSTCVDRRARPRAAAAAAARRWPRSRCVDAPPLDEGFGTTGKRQLVLAVRRATTTPRFFALLGAADEPVLTVVRRG